MISKEDLVSAVLDLGKYQKKAHKQMKQRSKKADERSKEADERSKKADERSKEADERSKKADERSKKADKRIKKLEIQVAKTEVMVQKVSQLIGNVSNNQGYVAEEFFYNSLSSTPVLNGINYDFTDKNASRKRHNIEDEFDILMVNGKDIAIIETKYKAHSTDVEKLANKKLTNFKILYPEYKDYTHHLALASFYINDAVKQEAKSNNVILLKRKGDLIEII